MSALGPPTDTPRHTPAESHPCEATENIWVGESKPAALACAEAAWEQSSLGASLHTWPQPHECSPGLTCMGSCIDSQKTHNSRLKSLKVHSLA